MIRSGFKTNDHDPARQQIMMHPMTRKALWRIIVQAFNLLNIPLYWFIGKPCKTRPFQSESGVDVFKNRSDWARSYLCPGSFASLE
jgi:hypothetical protein